MNQSVGERLLKFMVALIMKALNILNRVRIQTRYSTSTSLTSIILSSELTAFKVVQNYNLVKIKFFILQCFKITSTCF